MYVIGIILGRPTYSKLPSDTLKLQKAMIQTLSILAHFYWIGQAIINKIVNYKPYI